MQTVAVRNGVKKRRKTTVKRRNTATRSTVARANPKRRVVRRRRRNPIMAAGTKIARVNPAKRKTVKRRRRNGATRRNGVLTGIMPIFKTVALGGGGAVVTGILSNGVNSLAGGLINSLPIPNFVVRAGVEVAIAVFPVKMVAEKIFNKDDAGKIVAGGLIKAGLTAISGIAPGVVAFNPLENTKLLGNQYGQMDDSPIVETDTFAGAEDFGGAEPLYG